MVDYTKSGLPNSTNYNISCEGDYCPPDCPDAFAMVHVSYLIRGGTRVMWQMLPDFVDPLPWSFQLQVGHTGIQAADDWTNVGLPADKTQNTHYRVVVTTSKGVYYSDLTAKDGILGVRDWRIAREIVRKEKLRFRYTSQDGYLLKRRVSGENCTLCLDFQTNEVTDPYCQECWGTGKQCGYFYPLACIWADLAPKTRNMHIEDQGRRGTVNDVIVTGRMLMLPLISEQDVWVSRKTDDRYYIRSIQDVAEIRGVPLVANVEMRPAPFTDVIYQIAIPQQDAWLQAHC
jgi:hypothetical protein